MTAPARSLQRSPLTRRRLKSRGLSYLARPGEGCTLVFLHGIGSRASSFGDLIASLGMDNPIIAWDAPGYGDSSPLHAPWPRAEDYAFALDDLLAHEKVKRVILVGHSLGTLIAASYARLFPERVQGLVLMSPTLGYGASVGGPLPETIQLRIDELETSGADAFAAMRGPRLVHQPEMRPAIVEAVVSAMAGVKQPGYGQAARMLASGRLGEDFVQTNAACLILVGAEDRITPPDIARRIEAMDGKRKTRHGARLILVPSAGHAVYLEAREPVAASLCDFTAALSGELHV